MNTQTNAIFYIHDEISLKSFFNNFLWSILNAVTSQSTGTAQVLLHYTETLRN